MSDSDAPAPVKGMHLRGETCSLRAAFRNWLLFIAVLAVAPVLITWCGWMEYAHPHRYWFWLMERLSPFKSFLMGPEELIQSVIYRHTQSIVQTGGNYPMWLRGWDDMTWGVASGQRFLFVARLCIVFAWGASRLRRGRRAPFVRNGFRAKRYRYNRRWHP